MSKIIEGNTNRTITFNNLEEEKYYYIVVAYNDYGNTTSNLINITVQYPPREFFLFHDADFPDNDGTVNFTWSPSQGADSYELYINNSLYKDNIMSTSCVVNDLDTDDYKVYINAINEAGKCSSDEIAISVRRSPTLFSLSTDAGNPDTDGTFELIWAKSSYASYYVIYNSTTFISKINNSISVLLNFTPSLDLPTYRYNLSGLNNGTFYYKITAFNQYGIFSTECILVNVTIPHKRLEPEDTEQYKFPFEIILYVMFFALLGILIFIYKKYKK